MKELVVNSERLIVSEETKEKLYDNIQKNSEGEKGGFLLGRSTPKGKTTILDITTPYPKDRRTFIGFIRQDKKHLEYLKSAKDRLIYFKGNWHTHPQDYPSPSYIDRISWKNTLKTAKVTRTNYIYFIIVGRKEVGIWAGNTKTKEIVKVANI